MKKLFLGALAITLILVVKSCGYYAENENFEFPALAVEQEIVELTVGYNSSIEVIAGSRDYSAKSSDESIVKVITKDDTVTLQGVKTGEAVVTLTDNNTKETKQIITTVSIPYIELTTTKNNGEYLNIIMKAQKDEDVWIDLNDNRKKDYNETVTLDTASFRKGKPMVQKYRVANEKVRIYGNVTEIILGSDDLFTKSNKITNLDVSHCPTLVFLEVKNNMLKFLDVSKNNNLVHLWCEKNQLIDLKLPKKNKLETLYCVNNLLTEIDLSNCEKLECLKMNFNKLTDLDVSACAYLSELAFSNNKISYVDISANPRIWFFDGGNNLLTELDLSHCLGSAKTEKGVWKDLGLRVVFIKNNRLSCVKISKEQLESEYIGFLWKKDKQTKFSLECN